MSHPFDEGDSPGNGEAKRTQREPQGVRRHLWLDLEDTIVQPIVDGWHWSEILPRESAKILRFIQEWRPHHVHIFSFAIHNQHELELFRNHTQSQLESALNVELDLVLRVDEDIIPACCVVTGIHPSRVDFSEMSAFWGKQGAFRLYMRYLHRHNRMNETAQVVLLDDVVHRESFNWPDLNVNGEIYNIIDLYEVEND